MVTFSKSKKTSLVPLTTRRYKSERPFDFQEFLDSFKSLDRNNYGNWPLPVKMTLLTMIVIVVAILTWFIPIASKREEIAAAESQEIVLLDQYSIKIAKAQHLKEYETQVAKMQYDFKELLNQLPKETRVSDLVDGINNVGVQSNIKFQDIKIEPEVSQEFFIEQPIRIAAGGGYHEFGKFLSGLAKLPRIITLHDFEVVNPKPTPDTLPETNLILNVKTYRSKELKEDNKKAIKKQDTKGADSEDK